MSNTESSNSQAGAAAQGEKLVHPCPRKGFQTAFVIYLFFFEKDTFALILLQVLSGFQEWIVGLAKGGRVEATNSGFLKDIKQRERKIEIQM